MDLHRAQISTEFFDQAEGRGIFVGPVLAEAHWHMEQVENRARHLLEVGNRTKEDMDMDEADSQQLLDELTYAENNHVHGITSREGNARDDGETWTRGSELEKNTWTHHQDSKI